MIGARAIRNFRPSACEEQSRLAAFLKVIADERKTTTAARSLSPGRWLGRASQARSSARGSPFRVDGWIDAATL